jgi:hypothetical protein
MAQAPATPVAQGVGRPKPVKLGLSPRNFANKDQPMNVNFWTQPEHITTAQATNSMPTQMQWPAGGLMVGDMLKFPGFAGVCWRVESRLLQITAASEPAAWHIELRPVAPPWLAQPASGQTLPG